MTLQWHYPHNILIFSVGTATSYNLMAASRDLSFAGQRNATPWGTAMVTRHTAKSSQALARYRPVSAQWLLTL